MNNCFPASGAATPRSRMRPAPALDEDRPRQTKRGKYTSVACEECKKRKLKCNSTSDVGCKRCIDGGLTCVYSRRPSQSSKTRIERYYTASQQVQTLNEDVAQLRQQVMDLAGIVNLLRETRPLSQSARPASPSSLGATLVRSPPSSLRESVPKQPQFIGPTRPAFSFIIGERSLTRMGIPKFDSFTPSGPQSPTNPPKEITTLQDFWRSCTPAEVSRLLTVWREEVESVYPFMDIEEQASQAQQILDYIKFGKLDMNIATRDVDLVKVALSTGIVIESHGKTELSNALVELVEHSISMISNPDVDLKKIQLLIMLSIYYFHCGEELLSWRMIGVAAREALEMGLHRKESLYDNFKDAEARHLATRIFWCVYVLDRRWSFGTSLSFALVDRDIDPELPEPDKQFPYLRCMVGYGRLCSKLWDAIPPFKSCTQQIPEDTVADLDSRAQEWLELIPPNLRLRHPRLGLAPRSQPSVLHRLRALLYLRGNHTRCLIHRHYLLSPASIINNLEKARLVVDIAEDSILVLMHLSASTEIYSRQQNAFNYFLISSLAIIFLAVCHAPETFAEPCRKSFLDAVELVRGLSHRSLASKRLWESIRGLPPRLKRLDLRRAEESQDSHLSADASNTEMTERTQPAVWANAGHFGSMEMEEGIIPTLDITGSIPDISQIGTDLLSLFDAFGQGHQQMPDNVLAHPYGFSERDFEDGMGGEISRRFQGLI
ncbi:putative fungal-specific transcription factor [Xylaria telfairii]|nr:putative fungal-specific transcription factor [Xylaria telfairii]